MSSIVVKFDVRGWREIVVIDGIEPMVVVPRAHYYRSRGIIVKGHQLTHPNRKNQRNSVLAPTGDPRD